MSSKNEKNVIITGGARGIGRSIVKKLHSLGHTIIVADRNINKNGEAIKKNIYFYQVDVSKTKEIAKLIDNINREIGEISILINNAGIQTESKVIDMSEKKWDQTIDVNLKGVFNCCKMVIPNMIKSNRGRIINISSISARRGSKEHAHYCASKAGILGFSRALALEVSEYNITVNSICPGIIKTNMSKKRMKWKKEKWLSEIPLKKFGTPMDVANMVEFLISNKADWITGQCFHINGGMEMY